MKRHNGRRNALARNLVFCQWIELRLKSPAIFLQLSPYSDHTAIQLSYRASGLRFKRGVAGEGVRSCGHQVRGPHDYPKILPKQFVKIYQELRIGKRAAKGDFNAPFLSDKQNWWPFSLYWEIYWKYILTFLFSFHYYFLNMIYNRNEIWKEKETGNKITQILLWMIRGFWIRSSSIVFCNPNLLFC